ncbi:MAG: DUF4332 domain-containing protein [Candidatus Hodarchaeota archaeon]
MNEKGFRTFMKRNRRSQSATDRVVKFIKEFERFLQGHKGGKIVDQSSPEDLIDFSSWGKDNLKHPVRLYLWGIRHYYKYVSNDEMYNLAGELREKRIKKRVFPLWSFRGAKPEYIKKLEAEGIRNVEQILEVGRTKNGRKKLSERTGIPLDAILEFVKLSDLARIPGIKSIRARLYYDAGIDSVEKMASWNPKELREMLVEFVKRTQFEGIAPLPKEAEFSVKKAKELQKIVEY